MRCGGKVEQGGGFRIDFDAGRVTRAAIDPARQAVIAIAGEFSFEAVDLLAAGLGDRGGRVSRFAPESQLARAAHRAEAKAFEVHAQKRPERLTEKTRNRTNPGASSESLTEKSPILPSEK